MKIVNLTIFALLIITNIYAQDFEGYILYKYQFLDSLGNDITEEMGKERGLVQHYFINSSNYKGLDDQGRLSQLYNSKDNMYYFQVGTQIKSIPGTVEYPKEFSSENLSDTLTVLGYTCNSMMVTSESSQTKYFFSSDIALDYSKFKVHRFGNWSNYMRASNGAIPLKYIVENKAYTWIAVAEKIELRKLEVDVFDIRKMIED